MRRIGTRFLRAPRNRRFDQDEEVDDFYDTIYIEPWMIGIPKDEK